MTATSALMQRYPVLKMSSDLHFALLGSKQLALCFESMGVSYSCTGSLKTLVRSLIETEIDLIVVDGPEAQTDKLEKIFQTYHVPFLFVGRNQSSADTGFFSVQDVSEISDFISRQNDALGGFRTERENRKIHSTLKTLTDFTNTVLHASKDLFISETKNFMAKSLKVKNSYWVEVKEDLANLPPILKLKQELQKQRVDQGSLIAALDSCSIEMIHNEKFQLWRTVQGDYLGLIWIKDQEGVSQCLVLNHFQLRHLSHFESFLVHFVPFLKRRWSLCLTIADVQSQIYKDSLTDLYNQKFLMEVVDKKTEEYKRYKTPFSVLFIDVDHFKKVNDSLGHIVGSGVLCQLGALLQEQIRNSDYAFRYGGDEFIVLLSHTDGEDAVNVSERIRKAVENCQFSVNDIDVRITVSIGLAFFPTHADSGEEIIRIADEAMYYGKNKSRNIVYKAS